MGEHTAIRCNTLQHTATHCYTLLHTATHCDILQHTATLSGICHATGSSYGSLSAKCDGECCSNVLQGVALCCNTLQHIATGSSCRSLSAKCVEVCCRMWQGVAGCCRVLQGVTGCCRVLQGVTGCCRVLQCIEWLILQITSRKLASECRAFLQKMTCKDMGSDAFFYLQRCELQKYGIPNDLQKYGLPRIFAIL